MKPKTHSVFSSSFRVVLSPARSATFLAVLILGGQASQAALTWDSTATATNNWSTAGGNANWLPGPVVWTQNESAVFDVTSGTPEVVDVTTANTFDNITFSVSGFSISSAGAGSFLLANDLASTITVTNLADSASIGETIANNAGGASTLTKAGLGTLILNGSAASTYSGGTIISAGTLTASHEGSLGTGPVTNNATLNINKANVTFTGISTSMTGAGTANVTALGTGTNTVILDGNFSGFTGPWNIGVGAAAGAGKVQMNGLDNAATTIDVLSNATLYTGANTHNAAVTLRGGDTGESLGQLRLDFPTTVWAGPVTLAGAMTGAGDGIVGCNSGPATISGLISESGGSRELTKGGGGTLVLTNTNTYTGATRVLGGKLGTATIGNTGVNSPLGSNSVISLGSAGGAGTLLYSGSGETTNRVLDLGGSTGNGIVELTGTSGLLKFTSNVTASGVGNRSLALLGSTAATGEIAGQISDSTTTGTTTLATAFAASATTITLASVDGILTGTAISGTGIAPGTTVTAINTGTKVVTLSLGTSGAGTVGQAITVAGVINSVGVVKDGTGTWTLSGNNTFIGGVNISVGNLVITNSNALGFGTKTVALTNGTAGNPQLHLDGSGGSIFVPSSISYNTSNTATLTSASIVNLAGTNTLAGNFTLTSGGGGTRLLSNAGKLTCSGNFTSSSTGRQLDVRGAGDGEISGVISNGSGAYPVNKDGSGTWTFSGANTYTGATAVNEGTLAITGSPTGASPFTLTGGTLKLDFSTNNTSKLASTLTLSGGTVELAGGSHPEVVTSTTLSGKASNVTRSSGSAVLVMNVVTPGTGSVNFSADNIASTDNLNVNGILPWARFGSNWGMNATNGPDGLIVAYTGVLADVNRLSGVVPDGIANNVRIINGGTPGNITLTTSPNVINSLLADANAGPATIGFTTPADILSIGDEVGGTLWQTATSGALTIGTTANEGVLTTGNTANATAAALTLLNDTATNPITVNSIIANNGTDVVSVVKGGVGQVVLTGNNTFTGTVTTGGGTLTLSGNNTFDGALTLTGIGTAVLSGENSGRPAGTTGLTVINNGTTLQLQANPANTTAGISTALSVERTANQPVTFNSGGLLQLRGDSNVTFAGGNAWGGMGNATVTIDVNQLTGTGSGSTLTIAPLGFDVNTTTLNITGGNGYTLGLGKINNVSSGGVLTLNPTTGNLTLDGYSANATFATTLALGGTATANTVTGNITNPATSGATSVTKSGTSTWTISGAANTYTGNTTISGGTLKAGSATAFNSLNALSMSATGVLDLNGFNAGFTNVPASATTNLITDNSAGAGTSTFALSAQASTVAALIKDGAAKSVRVTLVNVNTGTTPITMTNANTFSGGLVLLNQATGTRLRISSAPTTVGSPGAIVSSPFGTGPITIGQAITDKAGVLLDTANNFTIANAIVFNTALGTDQPGIRVDTSGHVLSGPITANLSDAMFSRGGSGTGSVTLTGQITGANGFQLNASAVNVTLANNTVNPNNYSGATATGAGSVLSLGAANQIPNGSGKGNVTLAGTLQLGGFNETLNGLNGAGSVTSASGTPTLTVGDNDAAGTFSGSTGGSLALVKTGAGSQTLSGVIGHTGDTTVSGGTLIVSLASTFADSSAIRLTTGAVLNLATAGTDVVNMLYINGSAQATGTWGRIGSGAAHETALITGDGLLSVTSSGGSPFATWINTFFPGETNPAIVGMTADPDNDGANNVTEFAFDGNPASGAVNPKIYVFTVDSDADGDSIKELVLTAAIRTGAAAFVTGAPSTANSSGDGIGYFIQGSTTLSGFPTTVDVVPTAVTGGLPATSSGWSYRSFSLSGSNGLSDKGFLRAGVTTP